MWAKYCQLATFFRRMIWLTRLKWEFWKIRVNDDRSTWGNLVGKLSLCFNNNLCKPNYMSQIKMKLEARLNGINLRLDYEGWARMQMDHLACEPSLGQFAFLNTTNTSELRQFKRHSLRIILTETLLLVVRQKSNCFSPVFWRTTQRGK